MFSIILLDVDSQKWCQHSKHVFILSLSGTSVYSRLACIQIIIYMYVWQSHVENEHYSVLNSISSPDIML